MIEFQKSKIDTRHLHWLGLLRPTSNCHIHISQIIFPRKLRLIILILLNHDSLKTLDLILTFPPHSEMYEKKIGGPSIVFLLVQHDLQFQPYDTNLGYSLLLYGFT